LSGISCIIIFAHVAREPAHRNFVIKSLNTLGKTKHQALAVVAEHTLVAPNHTSRSQHWNISSLWRASLLSSLRDWWWMLNDYAYSEDVSCTYSYISDVCVALRMKKVLRSESWNWHSESALHCGQALIIQTLQAT